MDEVVALCAAEGITVTKEELEAEIAIQETEELDENAPDHVSGGSVLRARGSIIDTIGRILRRINPLAPESPWFNKSRRK